METSDLKKTGIIATIFTFALLGAWLGFSKLSLGAYNEKTLTRYFLAEDSEVFKTIVIEAGTDTVVRIIAGTSSMTRTGTSSYPTQPRIEYSGVTGKWSFKNSGGTETIAFGTVSAAYVAAEIGSATSNYILQNNGSSTGQLATNPTLAGVGTITASFGANGLIISPEEYSAVNNATGELQAQINGKQASLINNSSGTITNVLGYTPSANTHGSITTSLGYTPIANVPGSITSALGYTPPANTSGSITSVLGYTPTNLGNSIELGTETTGNTDNISEGSTNKYYQDAMVNAAVGSLSVNIHNDSNINMSNENDFVKIVGGQLVAGSSSLSVAFSEITGVPTENSNFKTAAGTSTVPVRDVDGNLFAKGIVGGTTTGAIRIPIGTFAQRPGTPTVGMLRGVCNAGAGGTITTSGTYTVHTFTSSGTWTAPANSLEYYNGTWTTIISFLSPIEYLIVAGGGGGGGNGGGGAGGVIYNNFTLAGISTITIIIGAGGASHATGNNTSFGTITAIGGGNGGFNNEDGFFGGSGGGGGGGAVTIGGTSTAGQGYNGGQALATIPYPAGGGGGSGAIGSNASGSASGAGGVGTAYTISGASVFYGGGGGGGSSNEGAMAGAGGNGGGGAGGSTGGAAGNNGTINTGGGGGGGGRQSGSIGGIGGSGIVIIRYLTP